MNLFSPVVKGLGTTIDLLQTRHRVLTENVANAETPGYRAKDVDFGAALAQAFEAPREPGEVAPIEVAKDSKAVVKIDGNSVDLDTEMSKLSENAFKLEALTQILARKYAGMKSFLSEIK